MSTFELPNLSQPETKQDNQWFKQYSLAALKEALAVRQYPGYPAQAERLWRDDYLPFFEPIVLPHGPWETSDGLTPTIPERLQFQAQNMRCDVYGRPLHPWFDAMVSDPEIGVVTGKGFYWHWGSNYTADPIIVRHDLAEPHVVLIERSDGTGWALPGGFTNDGEPEIDAAIREAAEETGIDLVDLAADAQVIYQGPLADLRATAHAWPETTAVRFDLSEHHAAQSSDTRWLGSDDALQAGWFPISQLDTQLFGSHRLLIELALR